uniref:P13 n=1 Tax=Olivavirus actinidiae TaxID=2024724 RepID=A0A7L9CDQ8_9CLOS|nr:p13 [Actinidia virus 1]QOJ38496.1 P13 [Actinidia virus 1]
MGIINSLYEPSDTLHEYNQYSRCTRSGRWLPHASYGGSQYSSNHFNGSLHMVGNPSIDALIIQHNYKELEIQLNERRKIASEHAMERENCYKEEMRKRNECYARHKRRSKKRFSLYSLLYR